jgi:hypothetical protein
VSIDLANETENSLLKSGKDKVEEEFKKLLQLFQILLQLSRGVWRKDITPNFNQCTFFIP